MNSKENKMGKKKLLEYFGIGDLDKYMLGNRFFHCVKNTYSREKTGPYLDYSKFIKALSLLSGNNIEGRMKFMYNMFDANLDGDIEKDEMKNILKMFLDGFMATSFKNIEGKEE